jgi:hypothetical protein
MLIQSNLNLSGIFENVAVTLDPELVKIIIIGSLLVARHYMINIGII